MATLMKNRTVYSGRKQPLSPQCFDDNGNACRQQLRYSAPRCRRTAGQPEAGGNPAGNCAAKRRTEIDRMRRRMV